MHEYSQPQRTPKTPEKTNTSKVGSIFAFSLADSYRDRCGSDIRRDQEGGGGQDILFSLSSSVYNEVALKTDLDRTTQDLKISTGNDGNPDQRTPKKMNASQGRPDFRSNQEGGGGQDFFSSFLKFLQRSWAKTDLDRNAQGLELKNISTGFTGYLKQSRGWCCAQEQLGSKRAKPGTQERQHALETSNAQGNERVESSRRMFEAIKRVVVGKTFFFLSSSSVYNEVALKSNSDRNVQDLERKKVSTFATPTNAQDINERIEGSQPQRTLKMSMNASEIGVGQIIEAIKRVVVGKIFFFPLQVFTTKLGQDQLGSKRAGPGTEEHQFGTSNGREVNERVEDKYDLHLSLAKFVLYRVFRTFEAIKRVVIETRKIYKPRMSAGLETSNAQEMNESKILAGLSTRKRSRGWWWARHKHNTTRVQPKHEDHSVDSGIANEPSSQVT
ncbi:hypothetical protein K474DRAFT_1710579 [Panus rudis PR-1116 ss-1]|nr:hypothetical protein K474DRAFT_1710579 [Panus rudis PR-1116 ss-1]